jgi:hypothetical protein
MTLRSRGEVFDSLAGAGDARRTRDPSPGGNQRVVVVGGLGDAGR